MLDNEEIVRAVEESDSIAEAARQLNLPRETVRDRYYKAKGDGISYLSDIGYEIGEDKLTPQQAWEEDHGEFEEILSERLRKRWQTINLPKGPGVIWHVTDPHIDDPGCPRRLLSEDIQHSKDMNALVCFGGDLLNNWPLAGRLAQKWSDQKCTLPRALLRAQHFLELTKPRMVVWGNHEEFNPYLTHLLEQWLPRNVLVDSWTITANLKPKGGRPIRLILSHKFQKGSSWFHKMHGHLREMLEGEEADILLDGHLHSDGVMEHTLPERGHAALAVASGGYKVIDKFAQRISRSGQLKLRGRSHWIVYDPSARYDESLAIAFKSPRQAMAYLNGLQNMAEL